jgi:hypothetical protein
LGLWIEQTEGAKFWLKVVNKLKARGVNDIFIAVVDGLKGFAEAITTVFPQTVVQICIVPWPGSRTSRPSGASDIRLSARPGAEPGSTSFDSLPSRLGSEK